MSWQFRRRNAAKPVRPLADRAAGRDAVPRARPDRRRRRRARRLARRRRRRRRRLVRGRRDVPAAATCTTTAAPPLPLDRLVTALADADQSGRAVVQVVTHTVPVPEPTRCGRRLLPGAAAPPRPDSGRPRDLDHRAAGRARARRDGRRPARAGAGHGGRAAAAPGQDAAAQRDHGPRPRPRRAALDALDRSCDLAACRTTSRSADPHEDWDAWYSGRLVHRTYWLQDWPPVAAGGRACSTRLSTVPAALTSVARDPGARR